MAAKKPTTQWCEGCQDWLPIKTFDKHLETVHGLGGEPEPEDTNTVFDNQPWVDAGLDEVELISIATAFPNYPADVREKVLSAGQGSLQERQDALSEWRDHTGGHAGIGLPGATDDGPKQAT